ncbi:hypothetical protein AXG93_593s1150 [Marchantia polymorpha subsp. ruderalis]|uniref:Uncharacterized protein n=1 Tax=Marchantia polymorpha subsp. ruderalis TaxID=1480154 RepID=A0A176WPF0_MARPO|nr:hypothetical protein AXG93_593s1150 [Marchantia polymorpha subsp. ruderalis]
MPKERTLAEDKEGEDETDTNTSDQLEVTSGENLQSSSKQTSDMRKEKYSTLEVPSSDEVPSEQFAATVGKTVTEKPTLYLCQTDEGKGNCNRWDDRTSCKLDFGVCDRDSCLAGAGGATWGESVGVQRTSGFVVAEVAHWENRLANCEAVRSSELKRRKELDVDCRRLQSQLSVVEKQLAIAQAISGDGGDH